MLRRLLLSNLCLFLFLLISVGGYAQSPEIDSLKQMLKDAENDDVRVETLSKLFDQYIYKDLEISLYIANEILEMAEEAEIPKYRCEAFDLLGTVYRKMNVGLDSVMWYFDESVACCEEIDDPTCKARALAGKAALYHTNGLHVEAISAYQEALLIAEEIKDTTRMIVCLSNMATSFKERMEYDKSLELYNQALAFSRKKGKILFVGMIINNTANIYFNRGILDSALVMYKEALAIKKKEGSELSQVITMANIGGIYVEKHQFENARIYLDETYELASKLKYPYGKVLALRYKATSSLWQDKYEEAIALAREGLSYFGKRGAVNNNGDFHEVISEAFEYLNQPDSALEHLKIYQAIQDSIFQREKDLQIKQLEIAYAVRHKELENKFLKAETSFIQQKLTYRSYLIFGLIIALILACGLGAALYRNIQVKKRMNTTLEAQVEERTEDFRAANKKLEQANYELKTFNYIASHDLKEPLRNIGNYISLIFRELSEEEKAKLKEYFEIVYESTNHLYTLLEDLASYSYLSNDQVGKAEAISLDEVVSRVENGLASLIREKKAMITYGNLPILHSNASLLFLVMKNLIENGIKFNKSEVPSVEVSYQSTTSHHQLVFSDNGIGIDPKYHEYVFRMFKRLHLLHEYRGSGIGLAIVKLVVEKLGGFIAIESQYQQGSRFIINLPKESKA